MAAKTNVEILFFGDSRQAQRAVRDLAKANTDLDSKLQGTGRRMQDVGSTMTRKLTPAITGGLGASLVAFGSFDAAMTQSTAIMGDVDTAMRERLSGAAKQVARDLNISSEEAARSFYFLTSAGLDAEQSLASLPTVATFAKAGMFDMATATDLATDAQSALGLKSDDTQENLAGLARTTDVLVKANLLANASVQQFSEALTNKAGAGLRVVNKDIEEGVAVLAAFADQGVKGAEAGEKLNVVLRDVARAGQANATEFQRLGIEVFDAQGNLRNMADVVAEFERALGGMSDAQLAATLDQLGLTRAVGDGLKQLFGTSDAIRTYEEDLRSAGGAAEEVASKQMAAFNEQVGQDITVVKEAAAALGENLSPAALAITGVIADLADEFIALPDPIQTTIGGTAALVAAAGPAIYTGGKLVEVYGKYGGQLKKLTGLLSVGSSAAAGASTALGGVATSTAATTSLLGPLGIAVGAGALAWGLYRHEQKEVKERIDRVRESLDAETAALTDNTRETIAADIESTALLAALDKLGLTIYDVTGALVGEAEAGAKVQAALTTQEATARNIAGGYTEMSAAAMTVNAVLDDQRDVTEAAIAAQRQHIENTTGVTVAQQEARAEQSALLEATTGVTAATDEATTAAEDLAVALGEEGEGAEEAAEEYSTLAERIRASTAARLESVNPTFAAMEAERRATESVEKYHAVLKDEKATQADREEALEGVIRAQGELEAAQAEAIGTTDESAERIREWGKQAELSEEEIEGLIGRVGELEEHLKNLNGTYTANIEVVDATGGKRVTVGQIGWQHDGGIIERGSPGRVPGLGPDDRLTALEVGEEVLTADDPRHRDNLASRRGTSRRLDQVGDAGKIEQLLQRQTDLLEEQAAWYRRHRDDDTSPPRAVDLGWAVGS